MRSYLQHKESKNIVTPKSKKVIYFSYKGFVTSIVKGNCCFICGAQTGSKSFNDEHVIPNWVLKHFGTPNSFAVLPNQATIKYSQYKVPCCQECNSLLGEKMERPMSLFLRRSYREICIDLEQNPRLYFRLFRWMCLLFFKSHYKDCFLRMERDMRMPSGTIADTYCWHGLYHIHAMARQHYTHMQISERVYGSVMIFEALGDAKDFDYLDNLNSQTVMIKLGKIVIFCVLNDSRICFWGYREFLSRISGQLTIVQIRELFARLRHANENIKERPRFYSAIDRKKGHRIKAHMPTEIEILNGEHEVVTLPKLMRFYIEGIMPENLPDREQLLQKIEAGNAQFIFDENYNFYQHK